MVFTNKDKSNNMGITKKDCKFLFYSKSLDVSFEKTLMLGRLNLFITKVDIINCIRKYKNNAKEIKDVDFIDEYSEPLFRILGSKTVDSVDFSNYERASIIHDLNEPIGEEYHGRFSCIIDGGTIEHVFNFPIAIKNCMKVLEVGGHYIGMTPCNNSMGHGFYQFSPELYFRVFSEDNGFRIKKMFIVLNDDDSAWYEVADPKKVNSRVTLTNNYPLSLMLIAQKIQHKEIFEKAPQQIDYVVTWNKHESVINKEVSMKAVSFKSIYRKLIPRRMQIVASNILDLYRIEKVNRDGFGTINPDHFKKVEI